MFGKSAYSGLLLVCGALLAALGPASATSGPGCLRVTNVSPGDVLNIRSRPSASARTVAAVNPATQGILHLDGKCKPLTLPWKSRWCPVSYYSGEPDDPARGWVKARFVRDSDCP